MTFLSTPSGWRATRICCAIGGRLSYFYPRPPGGGRHRAGHLPVQCGHISIHALRVEGDQSTSSKNCKQNISIHALRVEGDISLRVPSFKPSLFLSTPSGWRATSHSSTKRTMPNNFYPRPPGGGRQNRAITGQPRADFYPRPPGGGRRISHGFGSMICRISIHALRVEGDAFLTFLGALFPPFLSPPPGWRATLGRAR